MRRLSSILAWIGTAVLALGVGVGIVLATNRAAPTSLVLSSTTTSSTTTTAPRATHVAPPTTSAPAPVYVAPPVTQAPRSVPSPTTTRPPATTTTTTTSTVPYTGDGGDGQSYTGTGYVPTDN
ncbi:MAG: hypothetical protein ACYC19_08765 [Acidimicrobiales bacterium]